MKLEKAQDIASKEYDCFSSKAGCGSNKAEKESKPKTSTVTEALFEIFDRLDKIEDVLTELQVYLNGEGILPDVYYLDNSQSCLINQREEKESAHWKKKRSER
jgi:hypothetical protein